MHNPYVGVFAAALAAWIFGAIWYTVLGRAWMAAQGMGAAEIEARRQVRQMPLGPLAITFVCEIVMALVMSWLLAGLGVVDVIGGAVTGLTLGVGFMATSILVNNAFPGRKLMLSVIDGAHWIIVATIIGVVLVLLS
ncbi:MAG TPA: DUF1761 domain-containing protein [Rhizomicrobium sp.]|nr:DUF1761 domain-containing protein [Rhizomicrobium sp.]